MRHEIAFSPAVVIQTKSPTRNTVRSQRQTPGIKHYSMPLFYVSPEKTVFYVKHLTADFYILRFPQVLIRM